MRHTNRLLLGSVVTVAVLAASMPLPALAQGVGRDPGARGPGRDLAPAAAARDVVPAGRPAAERDEGAGRLRAWARPDETVVAAAEDVVADAAPRAGEHRRLRVVTLREVAGAPRIEVDQVRGRDAAVEAVAEAQDRPGAVAVSLDTRMRATGLPAAALAGTDPLRPQQWGMDRLAAESAWATATGDGAVVAVVDSGVDGRHPDLAGRLTGAGYDFVAGGGDGRTDQNSHGTHVAGVVAAVQGNSLGVAGLAPRARVMPVRVLDADGGGWSSDIAAGITYAVDHGADVVNLSLGGPRADAVTERAVAYAISRGVAVVAAVGNERSSGSPRAYPAAYPGVIAVASVDASDVSSSFSSVGDHVDLAAPGGRILSTVVGGYGVMSGTSMATPFVSATAALAVDATDGAIGVAELESALTSTATDLGATGWDPETGHGLVSPVAALRRVLESAAVRQPSEPSPTTTEPPAPSGTAPAPADQPPAETEPVPVVEEPGGAVVASFTSAGGRAPAGALRTLSLAVHDSAGAPVAGRDVVVRARRGGKVVAHRAAVTDAEGLASVSFRVPRTTRFVLVVPATDVSAAVTAGRAVTWRAFPRVRTWHTASSARVRVLRPAGQRVRFQRMTPSGWVGAGVRRLDDRGEAVVRDLPRGRVRAVVTRAPGLLPVRTRPWTVR